MDVQPETVRLCDVVDAPVRYENRPIRFRGRLSSDCHEYGSTLTDFSCRHRGIAARGCASMKQVEQMTFALCPSGPNHWCDVTAEFTGVVRQVDSNDLMLYKPVWELKIVGFEAVG